MTIDASDKVQLPNHPSDWSRPAYGPVIHGPHRYALLLILIHVVHSCGALNHDRAIAIRGFSIPSTATSNAGVPVPSVIAPLAGVSLPDAVAEEEVYRSNLGMVR